MIKSNLFYYIKKKNEHKSACSFLGADEAFARAPKQSTGLFLCFALPFSNLFYYIKKKNKHKSACSFLGADEAFARLAFALAGTHPGTETVHRTVSMLRIALFESLLLY